MRLYFKITPAKFRRAIRILKKYTAIYENQPPTYAGGRLLPRILFLFYKNGDKCYVTSSEVERSSKNKQLCASVSFGVINASILYALSMCPDAYKSEGALMAFRMKGSIVLLHK